MSKSKRVIHFLISILAFLILLYIDAKFSEYVSRTFKVDYYVITMGILYFLLGYFIIGREKINNIGVKNIIVFAVFFIATMMFFARGFIYLPHQLLIIDYRLFLKGFYLKSGFVFSRN